MRGGHEEEGWPPPRGLFETPDLFRRLPEQRGPGRDAQDNRIDRLIVEDQMHFRAGSGLQHPVTPVREGSFHEPRRDRILFHEKKSKRPFGAEGAPAWGHGLSPAERAAGTGPARARFQDESMSTEAYPISAETTKTFGA